MPTDRARHSKDGHRHRRRKTHLRMGIPDDFADDEDRVGNWPGRRSTHPLTNEEQSILWGHRDGDLVEEDDAASTGS